MAWRVGLICGDVLSEAELSSVLLAMPIWATQTPANVASAAIVRDLRDGFWEPEPAFTLFRTFGPSFSHGECFHLIPTMEEHHPTLTKVEVFGVTRTPAVDKLMEDLGYVPSVRSWKGATGYRRPLDSISSEVRRIYLDARGWRNNEDVYAGLLGAIGAPAWHGHNFDALHDSVVTGSVNKVGAPFSIEISNGEMASREVQKFLRSLVDLFHEFVQEGCPVSFALD
jgi:hypothetical protein